MAVAAAPKWRRRADDRPGEIAQAALILFAERGYAAARLTDIAARAGVSKAALYLYYPTKLDLFRAVLLQQLAPHFGSITISEPPLEPGQDVVAHLLKAFATAAAVPELRKLVRMVIGESGNFPEIARAWRETVIAPALASLERAILAGQAANQLRDGDARLMAMSVVGPLLLAAIWREVMEPSGGEPVDIDALAREHCRTLTSGLKK